MKKILCLQSALLREIDKYERKVDHRDKPIDWERVHLASCAKLGYLLALQRGIDPILAACACSCHDYGRIITGKQKGHAEYGYGPVKEFLEETELFSLEEIEEIAIAVKNHSKKGEVGNLLEEIVKDADVLDFYQYGYGFTRQEQEDRYKDLIARQELHIFGGEEK